MFTSFLRVLGDDSAKEADTGESYRGIEVGRDEPHFKSIMVISAMFKADYAT